MPDNEFVMMKCSIKKTTHIVAFATLIGVLLGCSHKKVEIGEVYSDVDLINEFGNPTTVDTIVLKKGVSLYEFQGGLDKYICRPSFRLRDYGNRCHYRLRNL